jgi:hypothetical protein
VGGNWLLENVNKPIMLDRGEKRNWEVGTQE